MYLGTIVSVEHSVFASSLILSCTAVTPSEDYPHFMNKKTENQRDSSCFIRF